MGHYYEMTGAGVIPRHFVPLAKGDGLRPTRITDARKHGWHPSVTTIQGLLDKPGLNNWRVDEHIKQAYNAIISDEFNRDSIKGIGLDGFTMNVKAWTQVALDRAPQAGTDIHDSLEKYLSGGVIPEEHATLCQNALDTLTAYCGLQKWEVEKSFVNSMGYAGKVDLHCAGFVADWKSKDNADKWKPGKMAYSEMCQQLAAYRAGLGLHDARCLNVFVCIPTGQVEIHEWDAKDLDREFANFSDLLRIWLRNAQYIPGKP